jgi:C4-dicarboxylate transporter/malic acid transport protein
MSTGGLALLLAEQTQPHTFDGLQTIGKVLYIFDLVVFVFVTTAITFRFVNYPGTLKSSITHPTESLFLATSMLSVASITAGIARYGIPSCGPWLVVVYRVLFWTYFALSFCLAVGQYMLLFISPRLKIQDMTPAWDLPIFPFMLSGTIAATGAALQPPEHAMPMIFAGLTAQGLGMLVSMMMYTSYLRRMIQYGFPSPDSRPGMFIAVGPPSFTSLAIIALANDFPEHYNYWGMDAITIQILRVMSTVVAVFIWSLSFWFFCIAVLACLLVRSQMSFHLNWWAFVFPNVGFTIATTSIGKSLHSEGIKWVGSGMTLLLVATYLSVGVAHVRAFVNKEVCWPGKDADVYKKEQHRKHRLSMKQKGRLEVKEEDIEGEHEEKCD